jgi:hypothetical protein
VARPLSAVSDRIATAFRLGLTRAWLGAFADHLIGSRILQVIRSSSTARLWNVVPPGRARRRGIMIRTLGTTVYAFVRSRRTGWHVAVLALATLAALPPSQAAVRDSRACDRTATPPTFASRVAAAKPGEAICLKTGDYGTWRGTGKAVTIRAAPHSTPTMHVSFGPGDSGFTLVGMRGMGGTVDAGAHDFTIRSSTFTSSIRIEATNAHILLDRNRHDWHAVYSGDDNAKIFVWNETGAFSGVTVRRSSIRNGDLDGIHLGDAGINVLDTTFGNLCYKGGNHTDNIQFEGGHGGRIARNYVYVDSGCYTQGITSYDGGTVGLTIEDNVIDIHRPWGIELYGDRGSVVRHNTLRWYGKSNCEFHIPCGQISVSRKSEDAAGSGTQVYDNLTSGVSFTNGSTGSAHHNVSGRRARFVGPLDAYASFRLARKSRVGRRAASDGRDVGARIGPRGRRARAVVADARVLGLSALFRWATAVMAGSTSR